MQKTRPSHIQINELFIWIKHCITIKHFPGDGCDERDQHLVTSINDLSCEEWDATYGEVYKACIDAGVLSCMVGQIMQPAYSKKLNPELKDEDIMPASLSSELMNGLLREKLGFNGLIVTDATTMAGFMIPMPREKAVPYTIAAGADGTLPAVNGVSFAVERGEVLGVVGESGCGKSVMSMTIMKLIEKYGGQVQKGSSIELEGKEILGLSEKEICDLRGKTVSMISQDPMTSLNPVFTIGYQMVEMIRRHLKLTKKEAKEVAIKWLEKVGIPEPMKRFKEYPHQLSGGMCQRVIIAMALSCNPKILIADEPTTALDVTIQAQILDLLRSLKDETSTAIILITHDMGVVADIADKVMVMYAGHAVEYGTKYQIFNNPCHPYTQGLLASVPRLDKQVDRLYSITGNVPNLTKVTEGCIFRDRCNNAIKNCVEYNPPQFVMADGRRVSCWLYENEAKEICHEE